MARSSGLQSLFSQKLDRAVFATYFLGAVVPLTALVLVAREYALPALERQSDATAGLVGLVAGIGCLSLAAFFALRRLTRAALDRMDGDNRRLGRLLEVSHELASAQHADEIAETAVRAALALTGARSAFALLRSEPDKPLALAKWSGQEGEKLYQSAQAEIDALAEAALRDRKATRLDRGTPRRSGTLRAAVAVPLGGGSGDGATGALVVAVCEPDAGFTPADVDTAATLGALASASLDNAELQAAQRNFFSHVTELVVAALDAHVDRRHDHATRVARLANRVGRELGLDEARLQNLHFASLLHDLGMLKIPRSHQRDPAHYQKHSAIGHRMLSRIRLWRQVAPIVLHHHERFDGGGYPEGLAGEAIPFESRIVTVVDAFDAMTRDDENRPAKTFEEALEDLRQNAGTQFDPQVVAAFEGLASRGEIGL